jgi:hypothetical protein
MKTNIRSSITLPPEELRLVISLQKELEPLVGDGLVG